jgi:hypothetical protein
VLADAYVKTHNALPGMNVLEVCEDVRGKCIFDYLYAADNCSVCFSGWWTHMNVGVAVSWCVTYVMRPTVTLRLVDEMNGQGSQTVDIGRRVVRENLHVYMMMLNAPVLVSWGLVIAPPRPKDNYSVRENWKNYFFAMKYLKPNRHTRIIANIDRIKQSE